jgi:hypothetical protein
MTESTLMQQIWAKTALTPEGWQHDVLVSVNNRWCDRIGRSRRKG